MSSLAWRFLACAFALALNQSAALAALTPPSPVVSADPSADSDDDGLINAEELVRGTNSNNPDSDGDAVLDPMDGWPRHAKLAPEPLPDVRYAVISLRPLGVSTDYYPRELDDHNNVLCSDGSTQFFYWNSALGQIEATGLHGDAAYPQVGIARIYSNLSPNGEVTGSAGHYYNPGKWKSGQVGSAELEFPDELYYAGAAMAVNASGRTVGAAYRDEEEINDIYLYYGGWDFSASSWLGGVKVTKGPWVTAGTLIVPTAINDQGLMGAMRQTIDKNSQRIPEDLSGPAQAGILDGNSFTELGEGSIFFLTGGTPCIAFGHQRATGGFDDLWWAIRNPGDMTWSRESLQAWDNDIAQMVSLRSALQPPEVNERLEMVGVIASTGHPVIVRNGVVQRLSSLVGNGWNGVYSSDINSQGVMLGYGVHSLDATGQPIPSAQQVSEPILLIPSSLTVDGDRDGSITDRDMSLNSQAAPFRFWANEDIDRHHTFYDSNPDTMGDENEYEEDDIGPQEAAEDNLQEDWKDNVANSRRDLEDFNRLVLSVGGLDDAFKNGTLYLGLKWSDTNGTTPAIKLYKQYKTSGDLGYLTSDYDAQMQLPEQAIINAKYPGEDPATTTRTKIDGTETFVLPAALWNGLPAGSIKRHFLFEVCTPGKGQLKLVILKPENGAYTEIGDGPGVWFDFKKIGDMYEQWSVGHGNGGPPDAIAARIPSLTGSGTAFRYDNPTPSPEEKKYILYVHGWNMDPWEKERFAETAYKRLWWQGYKGRFGVFTWPATYGFGGSQSTWAAARAISSGVMGLGNGTHFDRGEWTAWRSGAPLRQLLQTLTGAYNGELYVFSHSMGGIVVSEALRLQSQAGGGQIIKTYVPSQAALSAHTYDATLSPAAGSPNALQWIYNHPALPNGNANYGPHTPNIYGDWHGAVLSGGSGGSKAVGQIKNFYNRNDWALSAPVWQFNQLTKPDWPDPNNDQPWIYGYVSGLGAPPNTYSSFARGNYFDEFGDLVPSKVLDQGSAADVKDRYEIMAFAAESQVKALGATDNVRQGPISDGVDLQAIWGADPRGQNHRTHRWHSGQFRNYIQYQRTYWAALLDENGFNLPFTELR